MTTNSNILALTNANDGQEFNVKPGVFVTVTLPSNQGSTGYHWVDASPYNDSHENSDIVVSVFNFLGQNYTPGISRALGAPGIEVLSYQQDSIGIGSIKINLVSPSGQVEKTLNFSFMATN